MTTHNDLATANRPSRRSVTRAAAWSVPVVAVAATAPAYAASPCDPKATTVDWANAGRYSRTSASSATYTIPDPDGSGPAQPLTLTVSTTFVGSNTRLGDQYFNFGMNGGVNDNLRTITAVGGSGSGAASLQLHQSPWDDRQKVDTWSTTSNKSVTTFTFSRPVTGLTFTIRDIDSSYGDFWDGIALAGAAFTHSKANAAFVGGTGTTTNPFRASGNNGSVGDGSTDGNVTITMASVTSFEFHYWNLSNVGSDADGDQKVFLSSFAFDYKPC